MDLAAKEQSSGSAVSDLQKHLRDGSFVVTAELSPPVSADPAEFIERALALQSLVTAINVTDGAAGRSSRRLAPQRAAREDAGGRRVHTDAVLHGCGRGAALCGAAARPGGGAKTADPGRHCSYSLGALGALDEGETLWSDHP